VSDHESDRDDTVEKAHVEYREAVDEEMRRLGGEEDCSMQTHVSPSGVFQAATRSLPEKWALGAQFSGLFDDLFCKGTGTDEN
jgi:hypothetical protein